MNHQKSGCPLCGRELGERPRTLEICGGCASGMDRLHRAVAATGEFTAVPDVTEDDVIAALDRDLGAAPATAGKACSGCGKRAADVRKLLEAPGLIICDECVRLCADILDAELGDGWR